ncbi:MAG: alkaline phosphatase family protein [Promethearchaeota archaeon]
MNNQKKKLVLIGLDCASPRTLFNEFIDDCPNIRKLMGKGVYGKLKSSDPPITIPAWMVMATGKKAGTLGLYGFRHRKQYAYNDFWIASSYSIKEPTIWDIIGKSGLKSIIIGTPPTYPVKSINGNLIAGFIAPDIDSNYTFPPELKEEIKREVGKYILDANFRIDDKKALLNEIYEMTTIQFKTIRHLMKTKEWDYFQFVIIGLDRFHHAFWKYFDKEHSKYIPGNEFENEMRNYYRFLDKEVGEVLDLLDDITTVIIASDHGAKAMKGLICINMAFEELGLLVFKKRPEPGTRLENAEIDWSKTYAWGWGGYYARIFLNVEGREPQGIIKEEDYEKMRTYVAEKIKSIKDDAGNIMNTRVYRPEDFYSKIRGDPPDLMVYFDDLNWRSAGTVGYDSMYLKENDTGPDDAVHDYYGIYIISNPKLKIGKELGTKSILDIAPTCLSILGIEIPKDMEGNIIKF